MNVQPKSGPHASDTQIRRQIMLRRGGLYLSADLYQTYFPGLETVALMRRHDDLVILPVHQATAGGYLLKLMNRAGDRVIHADDFFRINELPETVEVILDVVWDTEIAGLIVANAFKL